MSNLSLKIVKLLTKKRLTVSFAESCTGGLLASSITSISGSSKVFNMGLVTYSNNAKVKLLQVPKKTITKYGAVSYEINPMVSWARGKYVSWDENILPTEGVDAATAAANALYNARYARTGQWDDVQWGFNANGFFTSQSQIDNHPVDADNAGNQTVIVGDLIFVDQNGDGLLDWKDQVIIGKGGMPKWNYSTWTNARWGNWSVQALWQGATGYTVTFGGTASWQGLNSHQAIPTQVAYDNRSVKGANGDVEILRRFPPANNTGGVPSISSRASDFTKIDAWYLRLKTLNVAYNIPKNVTDKLGLDAIQLYLAGNNVFTVDNLEIWSGLYAVSYTHLTLPTKA